MHFGNKYILTFRVVVLHSVSERQTDSIMALKKIRSHTELQNQLDAVMGWVRTRLEANDVPRVDDVVAYAHTTLEFRDLTRRAIASRLRLIPEYAMNSTQQRERFRSRKYRPIVVNSLGHLHGDLGYFQKTREYETPPTYSAGFLVCKDILSRFTYVVILRKNKSAESMIVAFKEIIKQFEIQNDGAHVKSISFDKETSVMGHKVQNFLAEMNIGFHAFQLTASKSKFAEGAIKLIRATMARLLRVPQSGDERPRRWWHLLQTCADILNSQTIRVDGKSLGYAPRDINQSNLADFIRILQKKVPLVFFAQFGLAPQMFDFKFNLGDIVRPKIIVTSSEVIGIKRSEINLEKERFRIVQQIPYLTRAHTLGQAYKCQSLDYDHSEVFDQHDLALSA